MGISNGDFKLGIVYGDFVWGFQMGILNGDFKCAFCMVCGS